MTEDECQFNNDGGKLAEREIQKRFGQNGEEGSTDRGLCKLGERKGRGTLSLATSRISKGQSFTTERRTTSDSGLITTESMSREAGKFRRQLGKVVREGKTGKLHPPSYESGGKEVYRVVTLGRPWSEELPGWVSSFGGGGGPREGRLPRFSVLRPQKQGSTTIKKGNYEPEWKSLSTKNNRKKVPRK